MKAKIIAPGVAAPRGRLLKFREAVQYLGFVTSDGALDEQHLRRLIARKKIPVIRDGRLGFYERDLDDWIAAHRTPESGPSRIDLPSPGRVTLTETSGIDDLLHDVRRRGGSPFDYADQAHASTSGGDRRKRREPLHA